MKISAGKNVKIPNEILKSTGDITFEEFSKIFRKCEKGPKFGPYFIRGESKYRKNDSFDLAELLILDADSSASGGNAPDPISVHNVLKNFNINHFIYTSHSHSLERNKYRVCIECKYDKSQLDDTLSIILSYLNNKNCGIADVTEMHTWAQAWFFPYRDDPNDGLYEYYGYFDGKPLVPTKSKIVNKDLDTELIDEDNDNNSPQNRDEMRSIIRNWKHNTGLHRTLRDFIYGLISDGRSKGDAIADAKTLLDTVDKNKRDEKWQKYYDDIPRMVDGAIERVKDNVEFENLELSGYKLDTSIADNINWPPGLMGELSKSVYDYSPHPYKLVSIITALGLTAAICGRKFNIMGQGLNINITLLMDSGMGKDVIQDYIQRLLRIELVKIQDYSTFIGPKRLTGPKALYNAVYENRSRISIITEAGFFWNSRSGDQDNLRAALLDIWSKSGKDKFYSGSEFSKVDDTMQTLRAVAFSTIMESTPQIFIKAIKREGLIDQGQVGRMFIFRYDVPKSDFNFDHGNIRLSDPLRMRIDRLVEYGLEVQEDDNSAVNIVDMDFDEESWQYQMKFKKYVDEKHRELRDDSKLKRMMYSRAHEKMLKISALVSLINGDTTITKESLEWARELLDYEVTLLKNLMVGETDSQLDYAARKVLTYMIKIINGSYKNPKQRIDNILAKANCVPRSILHRVSANDEDINQLTQHGRTGLEMTIEYMKRNNFIREINVGKKFNHKRKDAGLGYIIREEALLSLEMAEI